MPVQKEDERDERYSALSLFTSSAGAASLALARIWGLEIIFVSSKSLLLKFILKFQYWLYIKIIYQNIQFVNKKYIKIRYN